MLTSSLGDSNNKISIIRDWLIIGIVVIAGLYLAGFIIFPLLFSFFVALTFYPLVVKLENKGVSRLISCILVVLGFTILFIAIISFMSFESYYLINEFSEKNDIEPVSFFDKISTEVTNSLNFKGDKKAIDSLTNSALKSSGKWFTYLFQGLKSTLVFFSLVPIYVFFMLYYRNNLKSYLIVSSSKSKKDKNIKIFKLVQTMMQQYIKGLFLVIIIVGLLNSIGLLCLGIGHPFLIGMVTGALIILPYIGIIIGAIIPISIALITKDSMWYPIGVAIIYGVIQFIEGNYITPKIIGDSINLNPLVIIVSIIIMGAIGGVVGMIIALPLMGMIKIYLENNEHTDLEILVGNNS